MDSFVMAFSRGILHGGGAVFIYFLDCLGNYFEKASRTFSASEFEPLLVQHSGSLFIITTPLRQECRKAEVNNMKKRWCYWCQVRLSSAGLLASCPGPCPDEAFVEVDD